MNKIPDFDKLIEPYVNIYTDIETKLILKIASNFRLYKDIDLKNSMDWYLKKVQELGGLNQDAVEIISKYSKIPKKEVIATLKKAGYEPLDTAAIKKANATGDYDIDIEKLLESSKVNEIINNSYSEINNDVFKMINTKAQESFNQAYMNTLNNAYTSIASGAFDYNTAISNALTQLNKDGIQIVSYKQKDGSIRKYTVESCVRRDMLTAIVQTTNKVQDELAEEMGAEYVEVSSHLGARTRNKYMKHDYEAHDEWQGKVYKIHGSDNKYPNLVEKTGYGEITGLGGVNCRHIKWPFFPGISVPRKDFVDKKANDKAYELSQKQRAFETKIRGYKREIEIGKISQDINKVNKYNSKLQNTFAEYDQFCKDNNLTRDYNRERIFNVASKEEKANYTSNVNAHIVGKFNIEDYTDKFNVTTNKVILLPNQIAHIYESHPDVKPYMSKIEDILKHPDSIYQELTRKDTVWLIKTIDDQRIRMTVKLNTIENKKEIGYKNSIIQMQPLEHTNLDNLVASGRIELLYKK